MACPPTCSPQRPDLVGGGGEARDTLEHARHQQWWHHGGALQYAGHLWPRHGEARAAIGS
jgi:hypothetical protein